MRRASGFTLIELMIAAAIVAILVAVALPSYQQHVIRAVRTQGQQYLTDLAQRQEQYFIDARAYATGVNASTVAIAGQITLITPDVVAQKYTIPPTFVVSNANPPTFTISLVPLAGGTVANDGTLVINNLGQRWREISGPGTYEAGNDCIWEKPACIPQ